MSINKDAKNAISITLLCSLTYLAVYFAKNILSAISPQLIESGVTTEIMIGTYSSTYFICYAIGQLINGAVGDKIKTRYMICFGVILAGVSAAFFVNTMGSPVAARVAYGFMGFFLSMIFAPQSKLVAENVNSAYTHRCYMVYTFSAYLGSPLAGFAASVATWKTAYIAGIVSLIGMGSLCYIIYLLYERRGIIKYGKYNTKAQNEKKLTVSEKVKVLVKHRIIKFSAIAFITGVIRTAVMFWMPVYMSQNLGFGAEKAAEVFTVASFVMAANPFIIVFVYEKLKRNMDLTVFVAFSSASVMFLLVYFVKMPILNIIFLILGVISSNCASSMVWSRYCPSLKETGLVSTAAGFLDFLSYIAASVASSAFANAVSVIGWGNLILVWEALMLIGLAVAFPFYSKIFRKKYNQV